MCAPNTDVYKRQPYRRSDKKTGTVTDDIEYMTADEEDRYVIAQATEPLTEDGHFVKPRVTVRKREEIIEVDASQVDYIDVSPRQLISVATGMIPFLENDDANRALMGSNMQRQAVPLLVPEAPIVGTGIEYKACLLYTSASGIQSASSSPSGMPQ